MLHAIWSRWVGPRAVRPEAAPTTLSSSAYRASRSVPTDSLWLSLWRRKSADAQAWAANTAPHALDLPAVRADFEETLLGLQGDNIEALRRSIRRSHSLGDLWHLRGWLYTALAQAHSQQVAERQLALLHPHFSALSH